MTSTTTRTGIVGTADDLVLCRSDAGDGGWSLHAPGSTDEQIASGDAPYLASGTARLLPDDEWSRPTRADYARAWKLYTHRA